MIESCPEKWVHFLLFLTPFLLFMLDGNPGLIKYFRWECKRMNGVHLVVIQDKKVSIEHLEWEPPQDMAYSFFGEFPQSGDYSLILKKIKGRGEITLCQQPFSENGFTAKVLVDDGPYSDHDAYVFELYIVKNAEYEKIAKTPEEIALGKTGIPIGQMRCYLVGHGHIDLSWLWPKSETIHQVCPNTFNNVLKLMEKYPSVYYSQSSAQIYHWMEEYYPDLFNKIRCRVKEGRWEVVGGSWTEHSCNIPCGESLVRQYLFGKRYFKEKFGVDVKVGWLPDTFGFVWTLPQIFKKSGIDYFLTHKLKWQIERMQPPIAFPYYNFWWVGPDGSKVLACHTVGGYNESVRTQRIAQQLKKKIEVQNVPVLIVLYGEGDHGGGPKESMVIRGQYLAVRKDFPQVVFSTAESYFEDIHQIAEKTELPVVMDELYIKTHRGTLTTDSQVKRDNRRAECLLMNAEKLASIGARFGRSYPQQELKQAWQKLLFSQVHDNIDGSSIAQVYKEAAKDYTEIFDVGENALQRALETIAKQVNTSREEGEPVIIFNPLSWPRDGLVKMPLKANARSVGVIGTDGRAIPSQIVTEDSERCVIFIAKNVPATGYSVYWLSKSEQVSPSSLTVNKDHLENIHYKITIDQQSGCIKSLYDKINQVEIFDRSGRGNMLEVYLDKPPNAPGGEPAWNIYLGELTELKHADKLQVIESGPVRGVLRVEKSYRRSKFIQDIILYSELPWVECRMRVDWHEHYRFAKVVFPLAFSNKWATYEIPYGIIQRYDYRLTSAPAEEMKSPKRKWEEADRAKFEVAAQRWVDLERPDGKYGVSLLNDCKYGHSIVGNAIELSLIRGPRRGYPRTPASWADQSQNPIVGIHRIGYALYPHAKTWRQARTVQRGYEFNYPLIAYRTSIHQGALPPVHSFLNVAPDNVICTVMKRAEDSEATVLRLYETSGKDTEAQIIFDRSPKRIVLTDLLEWGNYVKEKELPIEKNIAFVPLGRYEIQTLLVEF